MPDLDLKCVTKRFPPAPAVLDSLSLHVSRGTTFALLGPSGAGKTTLLRVIAGLEAADAGVVRFNTQDMTAVPPYRRGIGMVTQTPVVYPHLSVRENLAVGWRLQYNNRRPWWWEKREPTDLRQRLDETAQLFQLGPLLERRPATLSGGERQRVALGRTLIRRPAVFLLDEPLAYLDATLADRLARCLRELFRQWQATVLWVTHSPAEAQIVGDRTGTLVNGRISEECL
jgi:ABC-type sugar transport system ATPase subunit